MVLYNKDETHPKEKKWGNNMGIFFKKEIGDIMDVFNSLYLLANEETYKERLSAENKPISISIIKYFNHIKDKSLIDIKKVHFYFKEYMDPRHSFALYYLFLERVFDEEDIGVKEVLEVLEKKTEEELLENIHRRLLFHFNKSGKTGPKEDEYNNHKEYLIELIKDCDISSEAKWNMYLIINNPEGYARDFCSEIKGYLTIYSKFQRRMEGTKNKFNQGVEAELKEQGLSFIKAMKLFDDLESYDNIYVSTLMIFYGNIVYDIKGNNLYVNLGLKYKETLDKYRGKSRIDNMVNVMKALGDGSRYEIISLLNEKQLYGQELAEALGLSTATISHHMNLLHTLGIVTIDKVDNKIYYKLNREVLKDFILDIQRDFKL